MWFIFITFTLQVAFTTPTTQSLTLKFNDQIRTISDDDDDDEETPPQSNHDLLEAKNHH